MRASAKQTQYAVSEIFLAVDTPEAEEATRQNIQSILGQLRGGANFSAIARQFSQAPSASNGGDLGLIGEGDMAPAIAAAVTKMQPGGVSDPIRGPGGYYVMGLREKKLPSGSKVDAAPKVAAAAPQAAQKMRAIIEIAQIVIPMSQGASKAKQEQTRQKSIEIYRSVNGCGTAAQVAKAHGARFQRFGQMNTKEMAPQFVKILSQTPNGRSTPPLVGANGVEMYIICSGGMVPAASAMQEGPRPTVTAQSDVTKEEVENRLYNQELSMLARRYLRDLRRDATIEMRDN
jgi:peptidyl-prolyl cis-trans isomerase SurA